MRVYKLPDTVLSLKGKAVASFLNGITSNTLEAPLNAFLNQHGRVIATFHQHKISDDEIWIGEPVMAVDNVLKHLERYAKLAHVAITRSPQFLYMDLDTAQLMWASQVYPNAVSDEEFRAFRLKHNIPLMGEDYQPDEFILNVHEHSYVSYTKGCFLGQEPVAKVHNRSRPTRKLVVEFENGRPKGFVFVSNNPS